MTDIAAGWTYPSTDEPVLRSLSVQLEKAKPTSPIQQCWIRTGLKDKAFLCAFYVALPNALITLGVRICASEGLLPWLDSGQNDEKSHLLVEIETAVWSSIVAGISFLVVFRASQAYTRFWQAITSVYHLHIEWYDACGALVSFCATSQASTHQILYFKRLMVRLFSLYHAAAMLRLVEPGIDDEAIGEIQVLDPFHFDENTTSSFHSSPLRLELVGQWIQVAIMKGVQDGIVQAPAPIVARSFQELANGSVQFQDALKVKNISFPKTYQLVCDALLGMHWIATPYLTSLWVNSPTLASMIAFCSVFVFWSLIFVARSIENPFSTAQFIKEATDIQDEFNKKLVMLLEPIAATLPHLPSIGSKDLESSAIQCADLADYWEREPAKDKIPSSPTMSRGTLGDAVQKSRVGFRQGTVPLEVLLRGAAGEDDERQHLKKRQVVEEQERQHPKRRPSMEEDAPQYLKNPSHCEPSHRFERSDGGRNVRFHSESLVYDARQQASEANGRDDDGAHEGDDCIQVRGWSSAAQADQLSVLDVAGGSTSPPAREVAPQSGASASAWSRRVEAYSQWSANNSFVRPRVVDGGVDVSTRTTCGGLGNMTRIVAGEQSSCMSLSQAMVEPSSHDAAGAA